MLITRKQTWNGEEGVIIASRGSSSLRGGGNIWNWPTTADIILVKRWRSGYSSVQRTAWAKKPQQESLWHIWRVTLLWLWQGGYVLKFALSLVFFTWTPLKPGFYGVISTLVYFNGVQNFKTALYSVRSQWFYLFIPTENLFTVSILPTIVLALNTSTVSLLMY